VQPIFHHPHSYAHFILEEEAQQRRDQEGQAGS
jgi:hypothetical protein